MCFVCLGDRTDPSTGQTCLRCEGTGIDPDPAAGCGRHCRIDVVCELCAGSGKWGRITCRWCQGTGIGPSFHCACPDCHESDHYDASARAGLGVA
jgi:DnaJ-class molecular chaperone